jgi:hypothetical protein
MLNGQLEAFERHKQMIPLVIAAVSIASYMIPINSIQSNSISASSSGYRAVSVSLPAVTNSHIALCMTVNSCISD